MNPIDTALTEADRAWRRYGISPADRARLAADLRADLESAAADGRGPGELLGPDVASFARRLAAEAGLPRVVPERRRLLETTFFGAAVGALIGFFLLEWAAGAFTRAMMPPEPVPVQVAVTVYYGIPAAVVVAGAIIAVRVQLRDLSRIGPIARRMTVLLPLAGALITPVTMAFAWSTGYSTAAPVILAEVALVLGALAGATVLARAWALRESPPTVSPAGAR
ncbi:DUF1048 domain-containing protein [Jidongwangia harbinensis]|uniref:DUF1048 domain-containing protein n=1 Tax=Jidongwangia harbinensis TaxID=2878561 RepID=UPI001CD922E3|nr:DUF1048 domain-containing protein [Jidongwangia harbinensis]MCA2218189.1 DUF1048 domain-containing protein [Jidongwangia harbinensis]